METKRVVLGEGDCRKRVDKSSKRDYSNGGVEIEKSKIQVFNEEFQVQTSHCRIYLMEPLRLWECKFLASPGGQ